MSAFVIAIDPAEKTISDIRAQLGRMHFPTPQIRNEPGLQMLLTPRQREAEIDLVERANGDFAYSAGTLFFDGTTGRIALGKLLDRFDGTPNSLRDAWGQFALIVKRHGVLCVLNDTTGLFQIFIDREQGLVSSSLLALAAARPRNRFSAQAVFEYIFNGAPLGNETLVEGVELLPFGTALLLNDGKMRIVEREVGWPPVEAATDIEACAAALKSVFTPVAEAYRGRTVSALSGGFDSRLVVAGLRTCGEAPEVFVYGSENDADVMVARKISGSLGLTLVATTRRDQAPNDLDACLAAIETRFHLSDGYTWGGVFEGDNEDREIERRGGHGRIHLSGGGGEIFRDFFMMADRSFSPKNLMRTFYCPIDWRTTGPAFEYAAYIEAMVAKIRALLPGRDNLSRSEIEWLYPALRCRAWFGREISLNNAGGRALLPLLAAPVVATAARVPIRAKRYGRFEAALIAAIDPEIARFPSAYGHSFDQNPPLKMIADHLLTYARPPLLRSSFIYGLRARLKSPPADWGGYLTQRILDRVLPGALEYVPRFVDSERLTDRLQFARAMTVEYFGRHLSIEA